MFVISFQSQSPDLVVVGGGAVGLAVAWHAARRGLAVTLLERDTPGAGTSHVAAGMLAPVAEAAFGEEALLALNLASGAAYPGWISELERASDCDAGYRTCGTLLVARDRDAAEALEHELAFRRSLGLAVERLLPSEARRRESGLAPTLRAALDLPDDHAVDPRRLVVALTAAARGAGVEIRDGTAVSEVVLEGGPPHGDRRVTGLRIAGATTVTATDVVLAAGAWVPGIGGIPDEARVPVRPVKGQLLRLRDPAGPGLLDRVVRTDEAYLVPRGDGRYVLGATVEERGWDRTVTAGAVFELLRAAGEVVPGISELELEEASAGLRPGTPDNGPAIGPSAIPGLHWAAGHYRHGILLAPITADAVVAGVLGEERPEVARPFSPQRFGTQVPA